eukprot:GEMP01040239.1.p1 GENE.GEMP01040239.1~~GEMP01040239.1.p1  ORF type:complete len:330 (+),score=44.45 GEMP01040239.1:33-992(+)
MNLDESVQGTHVDAATAKHTCASFGYIYDPWVQHFVQSSKRPAPLFNRGYWARVRGIQTEVMQFIFRAIQLAPDRGVQIVNIGSGLDTMCFWLQHEQAEGRIPKDVKITYFEIDFPEVIQKKTRTVQRKGLFPEINVVVNSIHGTPELRNPDCRFVCGDLRVVKEVVESMDAAGFDSSQHTCFVSECVLIYMQGLQGTSILEWAAEAVKVPDALNNFIVYEQTNPLTQFGKIMVKNLNQRGCPLLSIHDFPTLESQEKRYLEHGWKFVRSNNMNEVYHSLPEDERRRIEKIELLDELEELLLIQAHYFILVATSHPFIN